MSTVGIVRPPISGARVNASRSFGITSRYTPLPGKSAPLKGSPSGPFMSMRMAPPTRTGDRVVDWQ